LEKEDPDGDVFNAIPFGGLRTARSILTKAVEGMSVNERVDNLYKLEMLRQMERQSNDLDTANQLQALQMQRSGIHIDFPIVRPQTAEETDTARQVECLRSILLRPLPVPPKGDTPDAAAAAMQPPTIPGAARPGNSA
jgi:hypothetical protein